MVYMKFVKFLFLVVIALMATTFPALAEGLSDATTQITEIQTWLFTILFFVSLIYMMYQIGLAMADKQPWGDVIIAFGKVAIAGAAVVGATWAWGIWGGSAPTP